MTGLIPLVYSDRRGSQFISFEVFDELFFSTVVLSINYDAGVNEDD